MPRTADSCLPVHAIKSLRAAQILHNAEKAGGEGGREWERGREEGR